MHSDSIPIVNYAKKMDGTAIATRMYYEALLSGGRPVEWYQLVDRFEQDSYMRFPETFVGSGVPIRSIRTGYDRLVYFPRIIEKLGRKGVFIADPSLMRIGLKSGNFMVKVHDLIPISPYSESISYRMMFRYALQKLEKASALIVTTDYMKKQISHYVGDINNIFKVTEPFLMDEGSGNIGKKQHIGNTNGINITYVAADRPYKNINFFAEIAMEFQKRSMDNFKFTLVSKLTTSTNDYLKSLNLRNLTVLSGVNDMNEVYAGSDILVNPSLQEGFGRPVVEAMAHGVPAVAGNIEPFKEIVGDSGLLVAQGQKDEWIEGIISLSDPKTYRRYSDRCIKRFAEKFSHKIFTEQINQAFNAFLQNIGA